jgi:hypothetical protein
LVRASVAAGRLKLTVPLNATGKRMQQSHKHLAVTVKIIVVPPTGQPQTATHTVSSRAAEKVKRDLSKYSSFSLARRKE